VPLFRWTLSKPTWFQIGAEIVVTRSRIDAVKSKKTPTLLQCKSKEAKSCGCRCLLTHQWILPAKPIVGSGYGFRSSD
jgi:hypothetical protein